jgi:hypothetical protein
LASCISVIQRIIFNTYFFKSELIPITHGLPQTNVLIMFFTIFAGGFGAKNILGANNIKLLGFGIFEGDFHDFYFSSHLSNLIVD